MIPMRTSTSSSKPDRSRTTYVWDYENQPTQILLPSGQIVTNSYNADQRRVRKETT
jgi:YD repeat-containing protein